jgi:hypothetical protein
VFNTPKLGGKPDAPCEMAEVIFDPESAKRVEIESWGVLEISELQDLEPLKHPPCGNWEEIGLVFFGSIGVVPRMVVRHL